MLLEKEMKGNWKAKPFFIMWASQPERYVSSYPLKLIVRKSQLILLPCGEEILSFRTYEECEKYYDELCAKYKL